MSRHFVITIEGDNDEPDVVKDIITMLETIIPYALDNVAIGAEERNTIRLNFAELGTAVERLKMYGGARNRDVDHEQRLVTLTDDEAMAVVKFIEVHS